MRVVFRCDASVQIGSGHVMRCLTLADALRERGAQTTLICREHPGHLFGQIEDAGHRLIALPPPATMIEEGRLAHADWLGTTQAEDASQVIAAALESVGHVDWLIVDNYALDSEWESTLRPYISHLMVIDDLADRKHDCDLLLDQNLHDDMKSRYNGLVSAKSIQLMGPQHALLRPEFMKARETIRERNGTIRKIFVFFGGSDSTNETAKAIEAVGCLNGRKIAVDVIVGSTNPNRKEIERLCGSMPNIKLHLQANNIAELMSDADLAIGASGSTTWERCAVGLPSIVLSLAENQVTIAEGADKAGVLEYLGKSKDVSSQILAQRIMQLMNNPDRLIRMSQMAKQIVDPMGSDHLCQTLESLA